MYDTPTLTKAFTAGGTILANSVVELSAADTVIQATDGAAPILGVARYAAVSGDQVDVIIDGIAEISAGAAITINDVVIAQAGGQVKTHAPAAATKEHVVGVALLAAGADNDIIPVLLRPQLVTTET